MAHDHGLSKEQGRVVVSRGAGQAGVDRKMAEQELHVVQLGATGDFVAVSSVKAADQRERTGSEEAQAGRDAQSERPVLDQTVPKQWREDEVTPDDELGIVPRPGGEKKKERKGEGGRRDAIKDAGCGIGRPTPQEHDAEHGRQGKKESEVFQPEPPSIFALHPARRPAQRVRCGEVAGHHADQPGGRNHGEQGDTEKVAGASRSPTGKEADGEKNAEKDESRRVEEGHRGIERRLGGHGKAWSL